MLKNLFQKVFNFGQQEKENKVNENTLKGEHAEVSEKRRNTLRECCSMLHTAQEERALKQGAEALKTLEKVIEILEREEI